MPRDALRMLLCLPFALGCSGEAGTASTGGGSRPILDLAPDTPFACEVEARWNGYEPEVGESRRVVLDASGQLWVEQIVPARFGSATDLLVSRLDTEGRFERDTLITRLSSQWVDHELMALPQGELAAAWVDGDAVSVLLLDAAGSPQGEVVSIPQPEQPTNVQGAASRSGRIALLVAAGSSPSTRTLNVTVLDGSAQPLGPAVSAPGRGGSLVARPAGGFALASADGTRLWLSAYADDGSPEFSPRVFAHLMAQGPSWGGPMLLALDDGYIVAWNERRQKRDPRSYEADGAYATLLLQKLDLDGKAVSPIRRLSALVPNHVDEALILGLAYGQVALMWSSGPYEFDCEMPEACSHRDRTKFVLLDPTDLVPRSEVLEIVRDGSFANAHTPDGPLGWFSNGALAEHDGAVLLTATVSDSNDLGTAAASASVRCEE